jgi:hypothetical protein
LKDYYQLLQIEATATQQQVRKAYYKLAQQYHPDKTTDPQHHQRFLDINEAYQILGDKEKRQIYHYRWLNYKYPPPPKPATATQPRQPFRPAPPRPRYTPPYPPPSYASHYRNYTVNSYREYEGLLRQVCTFTLLISAILFLDYLFTATIPGQTILVFDLNGAGHTGEKYLRIFTENASFRMRQEAFLETGLQLGDVIAIQRTPLLRQVLRIEHLQNWFDVNLISIYHNFFALLLLQTALAIAGLHQGFTWPARMNFGIMAGVFTVFTLAVIFFSY